MIKINRICVIGFVAILALPTMAISPYFFPPDFGKTIVFRSILAVLILLLAWQFLYHKESLNLRAIKKIPIIWALSALFITFLLASIFSVDPYFSFWGWPIRAGGFVNFAGYIIFAMVSFIIIKREDWPKVWDFSILIGALVSFIALAQYFNALPGILAAAGRPSSTMGNPNLLAIYLLLLFFITLCRALQEQIPWKKKYYITVVALLSFAILLTGSRAAYLGLLIGGIYFLLTYPQKIRRVKIVATVAITLMIGVVFYVNIIHQYPQFLQKNRLFNSVEPRLLIKNLLEDSRFTALGIELNMTKEKPWLGQGLENFSTGFDKHYDSPSSLTGIIAWWDRAHNIIFQTLSDAGILGLTAYLALFFILFWQLQKVRKTDTTLMPHAIQATLIGYFIANLFSFDSFSSYLIFFLLIGYLMHLTKGDTNLPAQKGEARPISIGRQITSKSTNTTRPGLVGKTTLLLLCCLAVVFLWQYNIVPLRINAKINQAQALVNQKNCGQGLGLIEEALKKHSFLDSYARLQYVQLSKTCAEFYPQNKMGYLKRGLELIGEAVKIQPNYTRYWIFLGSASNDIAIEEKDEAIKTALINQAHGYLAKALKLAPRHQEIPVQQARLAITAKDYQGSYNYAQNCIAINKEFGECYFYLALSQIYTNNVDEAQKNLQTASKGFDINSKASLEQLANAYGSMMDYKNLASIYEKLTDLDRTSAQYHSSLAFFYSKLGRHKEARQEAQKVLELSPESKANVEAFLKTLPQ